MTRTIPFTEAKAHLSEIVDRVSREQERVVVTRNGLPSAVLVSPDDLEALEETVEILRDEKLMASLRTSSKEAAAGKRLKLKDHLST